MASVGKTIIHVFRYFLGFEAAHTQTTVAERECLAKFANGKHKLVEIGVYEGATTHLLANQLINDAVLYAIDPFIPGRLGICWGRWIAKREVKKSSHENQVHFIEKYSHEAISDVDDIFDFIFIDGDHSIEGITRDWSDWSHCVQPGGIIALHDTRVHDYNPRVSELGSFMYFESHIRHDPRFELIHQVDSLSILQRKNQDVSLVENNLQ